MQLKKEPTAKVRCWNEMPKFGLGFFIFPERVVNGAEEQAMHLA
jgi:hypothetical protein